MSTKDYSGIYRAVEKAVDKWLLNLRGKIDPVIMDFIYDKYHAFGVLLCDCAFTLSKGFRPFLPDSLTEDIVKTINHYGIDVFTSRDNS